MLKLTFSSLPKSKDITGNIATIESASKIIKKKEHRIIKLKLSL